MIDWSKPLEFNNGAPAYLVGVLSASGSLRRPQEGTQDHSELYAEMYEQGIRYLVSLSGKCKGTCVDEHGCPRQPWEDGWHAAPMRVRNAVPKVVEPSFMADSAMWGMF